MRSPKLMLSLVLSLIVVSCQSTAKQQEIKKTIVNEGDLATAYFASGCFWCVEAIFESVIGVSEAVSGYAGGKEQNPTYRQVANGITGHTETVKVLYDPSKVSYEKLLVVYYGSHDPTTVNGQHPDYGKQYRSVIFYQNDEEKALAEKFKNTLGESGKYEKPIATQIVPFQKFWEAEEYHQDFYEKNPMQPYVFRVSRPKVEKVEKKFKDILKAKYQ